MSDNLIPHKASDYSLKIRQTIPFSLFWFSHLQAGFNALKQP